MRYRARRSVLPWVFFSVAGCAATHTMTALPPDHPASPSAAEAPVPPPSTALEGAPTPNAEAEQAAPSRGHANHGMHGGGR